ncbi:MAG: rRNA maturation RNase YbeY [Bacilli bacterium]|jgi:probable rRNA maturation factor
MELTFTNSGPKSFDEYESLYAQLAKDILLRLKIKGQYVIEINIVSDDEIRAINKAYRGIDKPTDVISFAFLDDIKAEIRIQGDVPRLLGEIIISHETALRQAKAYGHPLEREMKFLLAHGMLHLLGYDHQSAEEERIMFALQDQILDKEKKHG